MSIVVATESVGRDRVRPGSNPYHFAYTGQTDIDEGEDTTQDENGRIEQGKATRIDLERVITYSTDSDYNNNISKTVGMRYGIGDPDRFVPYKLGRKRNRYRYRYHYITKVCVLECSYVECCNTFIGNGRTHYCSNECVVKARARRRIRKRLYNRQRMIDNRTYKVVCKHCSSERLMYNNTTYCSKICSFNANLVRSNTNPNDPLTKCGYAKCGKLRILSKCIRSDDMIYCSPYCCRMSKEHMSVSTLLQEVS